MTKPKTSISKSVVISQQSEISASVYNNAGSSPVVIVCEHASNFIPESFEQLGLAENTINSHIAYDIGALEVAKCLSDLLDAKLVQSHLSRLLYDCNRSIEAHDSIVEKSDIYEITGNKGLSTKQRDERVQMCYVPFSELLGQVLMSVENPVLVTVHSFTPVFQGVGRDVDIGIIHDEDKRLADKVLEYASQASSLRIKRNLPYQPEDGVAHTLNLHGNQNGYLNVMLEIKNDLLGTADQQQAIAEMFAHVLLQCGKDLERDIRVVN